MKRNIEERERGGKEEGFCVLTLPCKKTPLQMACRKGRVEVASFLIKSGANIHQKDVGKECVCVREREGEREKRGRGRKREGG